MKRTPYTPNTDLPVSLAWIRLTAGACGLIAILGLIVLMTPKSWAQEPRPGLEPGKRRTNPFASPTEGKGPEDEEDFEDEDFGDVPPAGTAGGFSPQIGGGGADRFDEGGRPMSRGQGGRGGSVGKDVPDPRLGPGGISVGGERPGGGIVSNNQSLPVSIDTETGKGSNDVVTDFNYPDADIMDIAKTLGKLTGKNFILDDGVKGRVSIISNSPITVGDAWKAFLTALDINSFTLVPSGKFIRISRQRDARDKQLSTYVGDNSPDTDALITRVFPLKFISADEVARVFRSFMPANSRIIPYPQTNTTIVTDTGANIAKLAKMLEFLDVEGYDAGIEVIPVKYASATELSKLIDQLLPGTSAGAGGAPGQVRRQGANFEARRTKEGGVINTIIADERTNNLIVHANPKGADEVRELVAKLDKKQPAAIGGGKIHVIYLHYASAEEIAKTLNAFTAGNSGGGSSAPKTPGLGINPNESQLFEGQIKVSADKLTNSIVVTSSPSDLVTVQRVIEKLDIPLDEVYVEAVIMEMAQSRNFEFSANLAFPSSGVGLTPNNDLLGFLQNPLSSKGAVLGFKAGGDTTIPVNGQNVKVPNVLGLVKFLQTNNYANVLATPQILTLDNTEATFESSERIPFPSQTIGQNGVVSTSVNKENVGLTLKIKPQINKVSNFVKLEIDTKLEDITQRELPAQVAQLAVATLVRQAKTNIMVGNGDTVVLGGLIRDKQTETVSKIPILGDIPILGWLFSSRSKEVTKSNMLLFLTPHIVRHYEKVRSILDKKLKQRDDFIEENAGGNDPLRKYRDDIIRSLPDIKDLANADPRTFDPDNENSVDEEPGLSSDKEKGK